MSEAARRAAIKIVLRFIYGKRTTDIPHFDREDQQSVRAITAIIDKELGKELRRGSGGLGRE